MHLKQALYLHFEHLQMLWSMLLQIGQVSYALNSLFLSNSGWSSNFKAAAGSMTLEKCIMIKSSFVVSVSHNYASIIVLTDKQKLTFF